MDEREVLEALREWAIELVASDDMGEWGTHEANRYGNQALRIIDNMPDGIWDSNTSGWYHR